MKRTSTRDARTWAIGLLAPAIVLLLAGSISAQGQVTGTVYTLNCPDADVTVATDINDSGTIVGRCNAGAKWHGFIYTKGTDYGDGQYLVFDFPGATATEAWGLNERGDIVGFYTLPGDPLYHGFVRSAAGVYETIDRGGAMNTMPEDINDAGYVTGCVHNMGLMHGFVFKDGAFLSLEPAVSMYTGVNESGAAIGYRLTPPPAGTTSFILSGVDRIGFSHPDAVYTAAWGLNQAGDVVGWYGAAASSKGFLRLHDGQFKQVAVAGAAWTRALGINGAGVIVGGMSLGGTRGFVLVQ